MGLKTWGIKAGDKIFQVQALKDDVKHLEQAIHQIINIRSYFKELRGTKGQDGELTPGYMWTPFGGSKATLADPEAFEREKAEFFNSIPAVILAKDVLIWIAKADALFKKHIPISDCREEAEEVAARVEARKVAEQEREEKHRAWVEANCGAGTVTVPEGSMGVFLKKTYNNSDPMTDYFDYHAKIGVDMLIGIVPKGPEFEATARRIMGKYPELVALSWTWHTENYSMGHGNYLMSEYVPNETEKDRGGAETSFRYEISMNKYAGGKSYNTWKHYPGIELEKTQAPEPVAGGDGITIARNQAKGGIEVKFDKKPCQETIDFLKGLGFRWSRFQGLWWSKFTEAKMQAVQEKFAA